MRLLILTFSNQDNDFSKNYIKSLQKYGYQYKILGEGVEWKGFVSTKIQTIHDYLKTLPEDLLVCITDCFDVLANAPPEDVIKIHRPGKIRVGSEIFCFSQNCIPVDNYWKGEAPSRKYVNGGGYMGEVKDIMWMYEKMFKTGTDDDQLALGKTVNKYPHKFILDWGSQLVHNTVTHEIFNYTPLKDYIEIDGHRPCFFHFPGTKADLHVRMNTFGRHILGDDYRNTNNSLRDALLFKPWLTIILVLLLAVVLFYIPYFWPLVILAFLVIVFMVA